MESENIEFIDPGCVVLCVNSVGSVEISRINNEHIAIVVKYSIISSPLELSPIFVRIVYSKQLLMLTSS